MPKIKSSISILSFLVVNVVFCFPAIADSSYTAIVQKINIRGDRLSADNINKIGSKKDILELADAIGNTIDNPKLLPKLNFPLGSIPLKTLNQSLKAKDIRATYYKYSCLSMRSQDDFSISLGINKNLDRKITLPFLVADSSFLAQGKPGSSSTGQIDKCVYSIVDPALLRQGDLRLQLKLSKQGYMSTELGFKVIAIENMQPVLKFDDTSLTLEDERSFRTFKFLIDGGSQDLQKQITQQITKNHPRLYCFITSKSVSEILRMKNPQMDQHRNINANNSNSSSYSPISSYPDYIVKINISH
jgi:hypothetical protein